MHARAALFDLFGDHLRTRGDQARVSALVRILAPLDTTAPAVRTAISRMVRQGWLTPVRLEGGPGYALTDRARHRLDEAAARIYRTRDTSWAGAWDMVVVETVSDRGARERMRASLSYLGYAALTDSTWSSPFPSPELEDLLETEGARGSRFEARDAAPGERAARAWDLDALGAAYASWHEDAANLVRTSAVTRDGATSDDEDDGDERAFVVRSHLVHEWRKFLFHDPGLPAELLPADWPGHAAARFFAEEAARLLPAASRFVDRCLEESVPATKVE